MTTMSCEHGEPRGARYCPFCRRAGVQLAAKGQALALDASPTDWRRRAESAIKYLAHLDDPFTVDDVTERAGLPHSIASNANNSVGALMAAMSRKGIIWPIGHAPAARTHSHGRTVKLWKGTR